MSHMIKITQEFPHRDGGIAWSKPNPTSSSSLAALEEAAATVNTYPIYGSFPQSPAPGSQSKLKDKFHKAGPTIQCTTIQLLTRSFSTVEDPITRSGTTAFAYSTGRRKHGLSIYLKNQMRHLGNALTIRVNFLTRTWSFTAAREFPTSISTTCGCLMW